MTHNPPVLRQEDFSIGVDQVGTGTESGHPLGTVNANVTATDLNDYFYVRIVYKETGGNSGSNLNYLIDWRKNGGSWTLMTTGLTAAAGLRSFSGSEFANLTDNANTTQRTGGGTFITTNAGTLKDVAWSNDGTVDFAGSDEFEILIPVRFIQSADETVAGDAVPTSGDEFEFSIRDIDNSARITLDTGAAYPKITYSPPSIPDGTPPDAGIGFVT